MVVLTELIDEYECEILRPICSTRDGRGVNTIVRRAARKHLIFNFVVRDEHGFRRGDPIRVCIVDRER